MMSYEVERAFGRILGLDYSQVNPGALENAEPNSTAGWPIMQPLSGFCGPSGGQCLPTPPKLAYDDIAALNRIYPITAANQAAFPLKQLTAANTVSIQGTIAFRGGYGMQGVNVVARPIDSNGNPLYQYTVTFVSGSYFNGNHGNSIIGLMTRTATRSPTGAPTTQPGKASFDLSGIPLPPGVPAAKLPSHLRAHQPLYILTDSVGPYVDGQVTASGTLASISVPNLSAGSAQTLTVTAARLRFQQLGRRHRLPLHPAPARPQRPLDRRLSQVGQTDWFTFPVRGNRIFTIVTRPSTSPACPRKQGHARPRHMGRL